MRPLSRMPSRTALERVASQTPAADAERGVDLEGLLQRRHDLEVELAGVRLEIARRRAATRHSDLVETDVLTVERLATLWGMKPGKVRELCRTRQLPARKLGREWVVPLALLREWARQNPLDPNVAPAYNDSHDARSGQGAPGPTRPYAVEVRRPARRESGDRCKVGDGGADRQPDGRATAPAARSGPER